VSGAAWVVFAYHTFGARALRALCDRGERVAAVVTHADDPAEGDWFESVAEVARSAAIPVLAPPSPNGPEVAAALAPLGADLFLSVWYRRLLGPHLLRLPRVAALNLHGSLLPAYRGRAPVNWVLVNGERVTGVTLHHMTPEADAGDIVAQAPIEIEPEDTALTLYRRMVEVGVDLLGEWYPRVLAGTAPRIPQDPGQATLWPRRRPEHGRIEWSWPARRIADMIRAVTHPYPGAFAGDGAARLYLWAGTAGALDTAGARPGTILQVGPGEALVVAAGQGRLALRRVQEAGRPEEPAADWARRHGRRPGAPIGTAP
jgi:UDP-4-amino-4-deoxy-L-arabinose formyltransferase/UDP-glucuronic acid dehydrogenase (UDP-4-keto-hexauronic acid decarboxylating)